MSRLARGVSRPIGRNEDQHLDNSIFELEFRLASGLARVFVIFLTNCYIVGVVESWDSK